MRVAINGFGRIGRSVFRVLDQHKAIDLVAVNDIFDKDALVYLLKYDTVMGRFPGKVSLDGTYSMPVINKSNYYRKEYPNNYHGAN